MSNILTQSATATAARDVAAEAVQFFIVKVSQLPQVRYVLTFQRDEGLRIWTVIGERDLSVREQIYAVEGETMDKFPDLRVGWRVASCGDKPISHWLPTTATIVYQRYGE